MPNQVFFIPSTPPNKSTGGLGRENAQFGGATEDPAIISLQKDAICDAINVED